MGTTFVNLQIREFPVSETEKLLPGCMVRNLSDGWTTVISENFQIGLIGNVARKLSKKIDNAILSIEYYDDDMLMMNIYRNGKVVTSHVTDNGYGYIKKAGNPITFLQELKFCTSEAPYLKEIFNCEDLSIKMQLLQKFFGVALWIDHRMLNEAGEESFQYQRDLHLIEAYKNEIKRLNTIKNQTKIRLLMEFEGALIEKVGHNKYLIGKPPYDMYYASYKEEHIYTHLPDGILTPLFDAGWLKYDKYTSHLGAVNGLIALFNADFSLMNDQGNLITKASFLNPVGYPILLLQDGSFIYSNYGSHQIISLHGADCTKKWELEVGYLHSSPQLYNDFLYLHYEDRNKEKSEIIKVSLSGEVISRYELIPHGGGHWGKFLFDRMGRMYYCCNVYENSRGTTKLFCLTEDLERLSEIEIDHTSFEGLIDIKNNKVFLLLFEKELMVIDIETNEIFSRRKYNESASLIYIDSLGRVVVLKGGSTVEILDSHLNYISRHRLKGSIYDSFKNEVGNVCFLTGTGGAHDEGGAKNMILRVYEIIC